MKSRYLIIVAFFLLLFSIAPTALAQSCGTGGTCKSSCGTGETKNIAMGFYCQIPPNTTCCVKSCTDVPQTPLPCATYAGNFGIQSSHTQGNLTWTADSCDPSNSSLWKYTGGCSAPSGGGGTGPGTGSGGGSTGPGTGGTITKLINPLNIGNCSDSTGGCLASFLNKILDFVIMIGAIVVMFMLVFIGFKYVVSAQKPGEIEKVHSMFLWTIVGALILIGAKAISEGIQATVRALGQ